MLLIKLINLSLGFAALAAHENTMEAKSPAGLPNTENNFYYKELLKSLDELKGEMNLTTNQATAVHSGSMRIRGNVLEKNKSLLKRMTKFAGASYCIDLSLKSWTCAHCVNLGRQVELIDIYTDLLTGSRAFVALDHGHKSINVVFRGSSNVRNWIGNLNYNMIPYDGAPNARVHTGFLQCVDAMKRKIIPDLRDQIKKNPSYKVSVVGHSLGGSIAALSALEFRKTLNIPDFNLRLITYGEPRIGNGPFADYFTKQNFEMLRVVHNNDIVPRLPPISFGFSHRKRMIYSSADDLYNCQPENWSDSACVRAREIGVSIVDHLNYFDTYLGVGC